jgi:Uma2 family endonuclease
MLAHAQTYRFTVEEYRKLGEVGLFDEDDRVELINGQIVIMSPSGYRHGQTVTNLNECLMEQARRRFMVSPQNPVELDQYSEPQPDIVLVPRTMRTAKRHPLPADVLLLIEVADSSLPYDRETKLAIYARTGIREFWIVNLRDNVLERFRAPQGEAYAQSRTFALGETAQPEAFDDVAVPVADIIA